MASKENPSVNKNCPVSATIRLIGGKYKALLLWNYVIKEKGLLTSSLNNVKGLVEDKIIGIEQRAILRNLYLKEKNIDIFSYYIGTIVFSALELIMRLSDISFFSSRKELKRYMNMEDVRVGIKEIDVSHLPL